MRLSVFIAAAAAILCGLRDAAAADLPLGQPADQLVPLEIDGYQLVTLDRTKSVVFMIDGKTPLRVDVPLFVYMPKRDGMAEAIEALKAVHAQLGEAAAAGKPVESGKLLTLYLAMDRAMQSAADKITVSAAPTPLVNKTAPQVAPAPKVSGAQALEQAILNQR